MVGGGSEKPAPYLDAEGVEFGSAGSTATKAKSRTVLEQGNFHAICQVQEDKPSSKID